MFFLVTLGIPREHSIDSNSSGSTVNIHDGPGAIKKIQESLTPIQDVSVSAMVVPGFDRIGPYPASETGIQLEMSVGSHSPSDNKDAHPNTDMNSFANDSRYQKKSTRFANEAPKQVFSSHSQELLPLPKTLKELLEEYQQEMFYPKFEQQGVDLLAFLELSDADLKDMGFDKLGPRKKIGITIGKAKDRLKVHGPPVDSAQREQLHAQIQHLNAKLHEAYAYIKEQQISEQHYRSEVRSYYESEQQRMRQIVYYTNDSGKNCKEAMGQMRKIKEFTNQTNIQLQKIKEHPNCSNLSSELGIDASSYELATTVKGEIEMACNRLDLTFKQIERTLLIAQIDMPQNNQAQQQS